MDRTPEFFAAIETQARLLQLPPVSQRSLECAVMLVAVNVHCDTSSAPSPASAVHHGCSAVSFAGRGHALKVSITLEARTQKLSICCCGVTDGEMLSLLASSVAALPGCQQGTAARQGSLVVHVKAPHACRSRALRICASSSGHIRRTTPL